MSRGGRRPAAQRTHSDAAGRAERYARMCETVRESLAPFARRIDASKVAHSAATPLRLLGTSGTVTTLASHHLELPQYARRAVDGREAAAGSALALLRGLAPGLAVGGPALAGRLRQFAGEGRVGEAEGAGCRRDAG